MNLGFLSKNIHAFGLHLSGSSFKFVEMEKNRQSMALKCFHETALPKGMLINDVISDQKTFDYLLKTAFLKPHFGRVSTNYVVASLPESKSFVRVIQIPNMSEAEAENAVPFEAESFIPLPIDQVYLDWQVIGRTESSPSSLGGESGGDKLNILIIASPKEFVDKYLEALEKTGLKPAALEVESQSSQRALDKQIGKDTVLLVDIGYTRTSLTMIEEGNLEFTSNIPIAGSAFTEGLARSLGISSIKAEEIKKRVGIANTVEYPNIMPLFLPVVNSLCEEIKNILKFHSEHSEKPVNRVILMGSGSRLLNLPNFLSSQLEPVGIKSVELANPWLDAAMFKNSPMDPLETLGYTAAIGLGIRGAKYQI